MNNKVYIGFSANPQARWRNHKRDAEKGRGYAFAAAIRKYGWEHFQFEVIYSGTDKRKILDEIEPFLIEQYGSAVPNGYNIRKTPVIGAYGRKTDLRGKRTEEQLEHFRAAAKTRMKNPEIRKKVSDGLKKYFIANGGSSKKGILLVPPKIPKLSLKYDSSVPLSNFIRDNFITKTGKLKPIFCRLSVLQKFNIWNAIVDTTSFLPVDASIAERIYCIQNNITQRSLCSCGKPVNYNPMLRGTKMSGYLTSCSPLCGRLHVLQQNHCLNTISVAK